MRGHGHDSWYCAPGDVFEWSIQPKGDGRGERGAYLQLRLIIDREREQKNQLVTRLLIVNGVLNRALSGDPRDFLYILAEHAKTAIWYRNLDASKFKYTMEYNK